MSKDGWYEILQRPGDVDKTRPAHGDALIWDSLLQLWVPGAVSGSFKGILASAPFPAQESWTYVNSTTHTYEIYYGSAWQVLHTLTPPDTIIYDDDGNPLTDDDGNILHSS